MDISAIIAENLSAWMAETPALDTVQKVEAKSGAGFGTIRRTRKGEGNITVEKLQMIAEAFGRSAADLLTPSRPERYALDGAEGLSLPDNSNTAHFAAESRREYIYAWPFAHVSQSAYDSLTEEGKLWVQGKLDATLEQARQQFGAQDQKRSA